MILETLDTKRKDIFIYSENRFDLANNFRMVNKNDLLRSPVKIHFNDVCNYINDEYSKSLILYRLLTNLPEFDLTYIKYGIPITVGGEQEIVHFDPVFAIKELDEYARLIEFPDLRFRIQQIGLISYLKSFGKTNYSEVYCFDLDAPEAKWQNDRVFAEIIFAFDEINFEKVYDPEELKPQTILKTTTTKFSKVNLLTTENELVEVDENYHPSATKKLSAISVEAKSAKGRSVNLKAVKKLDDNSGKQKIAKEPVKPTHPEEKQTPSGKPITGSLGEFIKKAKTGVTDHKEKAKDSIKQPHQVIDLFKSSQSFQQYLVERGKKQVVLKLKGS